MSKRKTITRDLLINHALRTERIPIPELDGDLIIREMTLAEREEFEKAALSDDKRSVSFDNLLARLIVAMAIDDSGDHLFNEDDIELVVKMPACLSRAGETALKFSGLTSGDVDELTKK